MKEKRTKKESIKKETEKESSNVTAFVSENDSKRSADLYVNWPDFINFFNETLKKHKSIIAPIDDVSSGKKSQIQTMVNDYGNKDVLYRAVVKMAKSDFLNGRKISYRSRQRFVASFPWLFRHQETFENVLMGMYDNPTEQPPTAAELRAQAEEERRQREEQRREESRRIEAEERERKRRERDAMFAGAVHGEELKKIWAQISLPPLKPEEKIKK